VDLNDESGKKKSAPIEPNPSQVKRSSSVTTPTKKNVQD
jgi:hypothetical protein